MFANVDHHWPEAPPSGLPAEDADRRVHRRAATVFTIGKITSGDRSWPCMIRDISEGGMRIQMASPPPSGTRVLIEMRGLDPRLGWVRWVVGRDAGVAFEVRCSLGDIFAARVNRSGLRARQPRFALSGPVGLVVDETPVTAWIADISVGGARLTVAEQVQLGAHGVLTLGTGPTQKRVAGDIRWIGEGVCGFHFTLPISSISLTMLLEDMARR